MPKPLNFYFHFIFAKHFDQFKQLNYKLICRYNSKQYKEKANKFRDKGFSMTEIGCRGEIKMGPRALSGSRKYTGIQGLRNGSRSFVVGIQTNHNRLRIFKDRN